MTLRNVTRLIFFAYGQVGRAIVDAAYAYNPACIRCVVHIRDDPAMAGLEGVPLERLALSGQEPPENVASTVRALRPEVVILAWWPQILRGPMLDLGQEVMLNCHPSLLPHNRGKDPNFWAIVERRPFGVTLHHVEAGIDCGAIAFQQEIPVSWEDTGRTLYEKATTAMVELFRQSYRRIVAFDIPKVPQDLEAGSFHRRSELDGRSVIDLERTYTARELLDLLRARTFEPHPACRFTDEDGSYEVRVSIRKL